MGKLYLGEEEVNFAIEGQGSGGLDPETNIKLGISGTSPGTSTITLARTNTKFKVPDGVTRLAAYGLSYAFYNSTTLEEADLSGITEIPGGSAMQYTFGSCSNLKKVDVSNIRTATGGSTFMSCFYGAKGLTEIRFDSLDTMTGANCFNAAFRNLSTLTDVYFPALTTNSFGSYVNQFTNCVLDDTGVTLHFPASVRANIEGMTGYPNFGGTNTVIAFDL